MSERFIVMWLINFLIDNGSVLPIVAIFIIAAALIEQANKPNSSSLCKSILLDFCAFRSPDTIDNRLIFYGNFFSPLKLIDRKSVNFI